MAVRQVRLSGARYRGNKNPTIPRCASARQVHGQ
jgi:hypothetical protein